mgnify:CR=1 FL=1
MLILASSSPRRKELLQLITKDFVVDAPHVEEKDLQVSPEQTPLQESKMKAYAALQAHQHDEILACDTVVILSNRVLGKPKDREAAINMLLAQSGKKQVVVSGYTYIGKGREITRSVATAVYFNKLTREQIEEYVDRFRPFDKAGAYGIQDDYPLIERIEGSYYNVMGLPVEDIKAHIFSQR